MTEAGVSRVFYTVGDINIDLNYLLIPLIVILGKTGFHYKVFTLERLCIKLLTLKDFSLVQGVSKKR